MIHVVLPPQLRVLAGIDAAFAAGLGPGKLNCVVMRGQNDDEVAAFAELTRDRAIAVRFIEMMPVTENVGAQGGAYISAAEILDRVRALGDLHRAGIPTLIVKGNHDADSVIAPKGVLDPEVQFLAKPFTLEALGRKVREVLEAADGPAAIRSAQKR